MARSDDEYDSDDSGFGFDEGLSTDAGLLGRIAKMRSMMNLAGDSGDAAPPASNTNPTTNTNPTPPAIPTPTVHTVPTQPARANTNPTNASDDDEEDDKTATATAETTALDEDEFLLVDRVHALSQSQHREQTLQAARASDDVLSGPRQGDPSPPEEEDEEGEVGAEDEEDEDEDEDDDDGYAVTWARGQLGLLFKAGARGETVIRRINKKSSGADGLHLARVGDVLVAVNGASVRARGFQEIVEQLRLPTFPVTLSFQPLKLSDDDDDEDGDGEVATTRTSEQREMERKQSSVSAISSSSSTSASFSNGNQANGHGGVGASPAHRLNQLAPPSYAAASGPASLSRSQSLEDPLGPGEYDVVWQHGSLGCGIKQRHGLPTIKSVTPGAAVDVSVQQIEQDDVMIRINGMDTDAIGFRAVVEMMRVAPKPLYMRFRRAGQVAFRPSAPHSHGPPLPRPSSRYENKMDEVLRDTRVTDEDILAGSLNPSQYTVLWNEGPLGVQIKPRPSDGVIVVTKFTGNGNPELLSNITIGDVFVRIAGLNVADMGIVGTCEKLKTVHKPVVLVFERSSYPVHRSQRMPQSVHHVPPAPPSPPPAPTGRKGFAAVDMDTTAVVPSFRELREREAAAASQGRNRGSFGGFSAQERGDGVVGAADRRAVLAGQRPASYDTIDDRDFGQAAVHHAGGDVRYQDRASDPSNDSSGRWGGAIGTDGTDFLPRFSDIENGRVNTTTVTTLPPPPAYHDTFTPSGRFLDPNQFADAQQPPQSPHSDGRQGSSVSSGQGPQHGAPPPGYNNHAYGYTQPTLPPGARQPSPYSAPAPPAYGPYAGNHKYDNGGGGAFGGSSRADNLRLEYMRQQREMNRPVAPHNRDIAMTELSTYTDLDDSGIMAAMGRPANRMRMQVSRQPLPTPELWIQWTEGPLGITFRRTNGQIVVSRLTGAGYSRGIEQLRAGDWLVSIGNRGVGTYMTSELKLAQTMELIKKLPKPVDMRFVVR